MTIQRYTKVEESELPIGIVFQGMRFYFNYSPVSFWRFLYLITHDYACRINYVYYNNITGKKEYMETFLGNAELRDC